MNIKLIGALLVVVSCGGFGFSLAAAHRRETRSMRQMIGLLEYISCELQYNLTPLPQLISQAAGESKGVLKDVLTAFLTELEDQISPNVSNCMHCALSHCSEVPEHTRESLKELGRSLGKFDAKGQLESLDAVRLSCKKKLERLESNKDVRMRSYQTLGLCAGAALAILLI